MGPDALPISLTVAVTASLIAAATDLWKLRIPNLLTLPLLAAGLIFHGVYGSPEAFWASVQGAGLGFALTILLFILGGMGAGDVKLLTALGAWLGPHITLFVFLLGSIAAGIYALIIVVFGGRSRDTWMRMKILWYRFTAFSRYMAAEPQVEAEVRSSDRRRRVVPFAAMTTIGLVVLLIWIWR